MNRKQIEKFVISEGLDERNRKRVNVYRRYFLANYMRTKFKDMTLQDIADVLGYDGHDDVIYGLKQHQRWTKLNDPIYFDINKTLISLTRYNEDVTKYKLSELVRDCNDMERLEQIKSWINIGLIA